MTIALPEMSDQLLCSHFGSLLSTFMSAFPSRDVRPTPLFTLFWFIIINFYVAIPFQKCWTRSVVCIICLHWYELTSLGVVPGLVRDQLASLLLTNVITLPEVSDCLAYISLVD